MNSMQVKDKVRNIANKKNVDFNNIFRLYMYDRFIERLSVSRYKDNFILKGGFYLSTLFGIENRTTMDIDVAITKATFSEENIRRMLKEIISIDINDNAILELVSILTIRDEEEYGGYRATINIKLENIKESFHIDIATGDPITPKAINYKYLPTLGGKHINLWVYNIETQLSEKLETILSRVETNNRTRDYYDIYLIYKMGFKNINQDHFRKAVEKTFEKRKYEGDIINTLTKIKDSEILRNRWESYSRTNHYAKDVQYEDVIECLEALVRVIEPVTV
ncbi:MAG: nucleotidyl transferase AbiEii/AbiGii toxin family protein [Bacilli bacterium]|nr:nucleotidyl transferase AbiEii/AbiGii toxin family protein [Bacilli bacterium]